MKSSEIFRDFQRLSAAQKMAFFGTLVAGSAAFLPWITRTDFGIGENGRFAEIMKTGNGFDLFPVFGFLSLLGAGIAFFVFLHFFLENEKIFGFSVSQIWIFVGGEVFFSLLLGLFVFASYNGEDATAHVRFGLPLSLFAHGMIFFGGYLTKKEESERREREIFSPSISPGHPNIRPEPPSLPKNQLSLTETHERK